MKLEHVISMLKVLPYSHPQLKEAIPPLNVDLEMVNDMVNAITDVLYHLGVWGVAAPEVGLPARFFVMDLSEERNTPQCFINPEIIEKRGEVVSEEDSLGLPGIGIKVNRAKEVIVRYQDKMGEPQSFHAKGLAAILIQQKIDQLNGITLLDSLSSLKREMLLKKIKKKGVEKACGHGCSHHHH